MLKALAEADWNYEAAAHLLNRAGFGGPPGEIEHLLAMGHKRAVSHLVDYERLPDKASAPEWAKPDPDRARKLAAA
ncbi:MAG TPA: hypothetical protein VN673_10835, partial [Clostridia bacterium]|nr:hypothetical protein [Clostridia bacterium]